MQDERAGRALGSYVFPHTKAFLEFYGPPPHECCFCGLIVEKFNGTSKDGLAIHHIDGNHNNNAKENLAPSHFGCHTGHHRLGAKHSEDVRESMRNAQKKAWAESKYDNRRSTQPEGWAENQRKVQLGKKHSPEHVAANSLSKKGKPWSDARREADRLRKRDPSDNRKTKQ